MTSQQKLTSRQRIKQQYLPVFDKTEKAGGVTAVYIGGFESNKTALVKLDRYKFRKINILQTYDQLQSLGRRFVSSFEIQTSRNSDLWSRPSSVRGCC
jgi:hypothetical protein